MRAVDNSLYYACLELREEIRRTHDMWSRRKFIFVGVAGAIAAGAALVLPRMGSSGVAPKGGALVQEHAGMLRVVAAAVLGSALPAGAANRDAELSRVVAAAGALIDNLPASTRREVGDLFGLLALKPARMMLGFSGNWDMSEAPAVAQSLLALRDSSIGLKQQVYFALHDMVLGSFYAEPNTWMSTGYPGPPKLA
jgi:hypothetical protein